MFPIRPVPDNDVKKLTLFVFKEMEDFKARGKDVDELYMKMIAAKKSHWQIKFVRISLDILVVVTGVLFGRKFGVCITI